MSIRRMEAITHDVIYSGAVDEVALAISRHCGDVRATIRALLHERKQLREQLALADIYIGAGFAHSGSNCDCL
ncbi:hypothetical protein [Rhizobium sp. Root1212]|uniref:hypothetical protein n=2 Tax=unclassified Rhizobium TaxID=2613769 RepID=UPI0012E348D1|nr:hypothetical protein [Rhizobium sp. Root1212]